MRCGRSMLAVAFALVVAPGCAQLSRIEDKVDDVSATSHGLQRQQEVTAKQVDGLQKALESEGITSDEKRADLLRGSRTWSARCSSSRLVSTTRGTCYSGCRPVWIFWPPVGKKGACLGLDAGRGRFRQG